MNRPIRSLFVLGVAILVVIPVGTTHLRADGTSLYGSVSRTGEGISQSSLAAPLPAAHWKATLEHRREQWREMIGLSPLPERSPLLATVTGTLDRGDYVVEKIHFQTFAGAHVTGNLYRPAKVEGKLPAVLYLCGHTKGKVNHPYQQNPRWFGQHGYIALVLDPIQLGECQGFHHGTYRGTNWDWPSRGYTPLGTEVWNGMRALDYLSTRPDVDPERFGVTGLSGGGVVSWALGAADDRLQVVVPVCQSGSVAGVAQDRSIEGHCDCAFWINYHQWGWPDLGALIAPRAFLIASGSEDLLWRPRHYRDVAHRIRHQYAALEVPDHFDLVEDLTPHGYTPKLRKAVFTFFNTHLKNDPTPVEDDVTDFLEPEENLLVFGGDLPKNDTLIDADKHLVRRAALPDIGSEADWIEHRDQAISKLRGTTFQQISTAASPSYLGRRDDGQSNPNVAYDTLLFRNRDDIDLQIRVLRYTDAAAEAPAVVYVMQPDSTRSFAGGGPSRPGISAPVTTAGVEVRGTGITSIGPGYYSTLRRTYPMLGQSLPERQTSDLIEGFTLVRQRLHTGPTALFGQGSTAPAAIYAAVLNPEVSELILAAPPESHEDNDTPEFLGVLRVGDLPHNLALVYPRPITIIGKLPPAYEWTRDLYTKLGAEDKFRVIGNTAAWKPWQ
jgi:dienelactone hydrolase